MDMLNSCGSLFPGNDRIAEIDHRTSRQGANDRQN